MGMLHDLRVGSGWIFLVITKLCVILVNQFLVNQLMVDQFDQYGYPQHHRDLYCHSGGKPGRQDHPSVETAHILGAVETGGPSAGGTGTGRKIQSRPQLCTGGNPEAGILWPVKDLSSKRHLCSRA